MIGKRVRRLHCMLENVAERVGIGGETLDQQIRPANVPREDGTIGQRKGDSVHDAGKPRGDEVIDLPCARRRRWLRILPWGGYFGPRGGGGGVWCKGKNTYDTLTSIQVLTRGRLHKPISMSSATRFKILASASEVTFFTPARSTSRRRFDSCMLDLDMSEQDSAMACGERHRSREALVSKRCGLAGITFRRSASKAHLHVLCARSGMPASDRHR